MGNMVWAGRFSVDSGILDGVALQNAVPEDATHSVCLLKRLCTTVVCSFHMLMVQRLVPTPGIEPGPPA